jgi:hypothetical protein
MIAYLIYVVVALYLGIVTSISPCPLAMNIAAISYIGRKVEWWARVSSGVVLILVGVYFSVRYLIVAG